MKSREISPVANPRVSGGIRPLTAGANASGRGAVQRGGGYHGRKGLNSSATTLRILLSDLPGCSGSKSAVGNTRGLSVSAVHGGPVRVTALPAPERADEYR